MIIIELWNAFKATTMRQIVLLVLIVNLAVCFGWTQPFSATQNLTIQPYDPYIFSEPRIRTFEVYVSLTNASIFNLGPALVRTFSVDYGYKNYTVPMPGVVYDGLNFKEKKFAFHKAIDPCVMVTTSNSAIDFPEAWTNAQEGTFKVDTGDESLRKIKLEDYWPYSIGSCNEDRTQCVSYLTWQGPVNLTKLHLGVSISEYLLSDVVQSITFRQIGSRSCPQNGQTTTDDDYSFSIDFSTSRVRDRIVLLQDLPQNTSFIVSITTNRQYSDTFPLFTLYPPSIVSTVNIRQHFSLDSYWTYIVSASLSLLLLLASSIAIIVLKSRQRRALRAEYENIPGDEAVNNRQRDTEEQNISVSS